MNQAALARACGVSGATVSRWLSGDRVPGRDSATRLRDLFGIDPALWSPADRQDEPEAA